MPLICKLTECRKQVRPPKKAYCSKRHAKLGKERRYYARKKAERDGLDPDQAVIPIDIKVGTDEAMIERISYEFSRGAIYSRMLASPHILIPVLQGEMTHELAGELLGTTQATMSRHLNVFREDVRTLIARDKWAPEPKYAALLLPVDAKKLYYAATVVERDLMVDDYTERLFLFRNTFLTDDQGRDLQRKAFHTLWAKALIRTLLEGGRQQVLSPPRHGKTQLLLAFCLWLIVSWVNVRIGWVAGVADIAEDWLGAIREDLEKNKELRRAYLPPGIDFRPPHRGTKSWSNQKFTVDTRTIFGTSLKSPTMQAVGAGGTLNSRDFDIVIVDDFEDLKKNVTESQREYNRRWFGQTLTARKEEWNAIFVIGSRQAIDDLGERLTHNPEWQTITNTAHEEDCELDPFDEQIHVDCMLWPEMRSYGWLMSRQRELLTLGGIELWAMIYLNRTLNKRLRPYDTEQMIKCQDAGLIFGEVHKQVPGLRLVGGLDPAPVNTQAAHLWGYDPVRDRLFIVDMKTVEAGGIDGVEDIWIEWDDKYGLKEWVFEETGWQKGLLKSRQLRKVILERHLEVTGHETQGGSKWDKRYGVGGWGKIYSQTVTSFDENTDEFIEDRFVTIPYGDMETQIKVDIFIEQAGRFTGAGLEAKKRQGKSDQLMAQWFPSKLIRMWQEEVMSAESDVDYEDHTPVFAEYEPTDMMEAPW